MKKIVSTFLFFIIAQTIMAQKSIDGLVQAEKNFAAYSVANNTRDAFLKFADSAGILFDNGKPVNAIDTWTKRENRPGKLNWWPEYAEIAASGDIGYTAGPWNFSSNDTIRGWGYFITVWHIDKRGQWKFLVDLGVGDIHCDFAGVEKVISKINPRDKGTEISLRQAEENFINGLRNNGKVSYSGFLSSHSRLYRNKWCAAVTAEQRQFAIDSLPSPIQHTINGSGIAPSGDLGYIYGTTVINGKTNNYLRIWRKEETGWKIALEVLRY